jgi:hypothetical protein
MCVAADVKTGIRFTVGAGIISFRHHFQSGSGVHRASYPTGTEDFYLGSHNSVHQERKLPNLT